MCSNYSQIVEVFHLDFKVNHSKLIVDSYVVKYRQERLPIFLTLTLGRIFLNCIGFTGNELTLERRVAK